MRRFDQDWTAGPIRTMFGNIRRRRAWFIDNASPRQYANLCMAGLQFALRSEQVYAWPVLVKVDISPMCNLQCTFCVHARPGGPQAAVLAEQALSPTQRMSAAQFGDIARQIGGKSMAVSLYYLGDPLMHPELDQICATARRAGLNVHLSSNFSFRLSDERLVGLLTSGLTHLTVCVDGMSQATYGRTRIGGRIDLVLSNLERLLALRKRARLVYPRVEVQYIKFQHNLDEIESAVAWSAERGVDQFTEYWGNLHNYADVAPGTYRVIRPKRSARFPACAWPHFALQIKYNGDVIPCCYHRVADQYRPGADQRSVGNVFRDGVWAVWSSPEYARLRRYVSSPERVLAEPGLRTTFCDGCPAIAETDVRHNERGASAHTWEELYVLDGRHIVRRDAPIEIDMETQAVPRVVLHDQSSLAGHW